MKKGFTLMELIAVIAIIAIIAMIAIPNIMGIFTNKKQELYDNTIKEIERIANNYMIDHPSLYNNINDDGYIFISIETLCAGKYLSCPILDPRDNSEITGYIKILGNHDEYIYKYYGSSEILNAIILTVTLNGGTTNQMFDLAYAEGRKIILENPTKSGFDFKGWNVVSGDSVLNGNILTIGTTDTEIYALWEDSIALVVDLDGGSTTQNFESTYNTDTLITLISPTKSNYLFAGWTVVSGNSVLSGNTLTIGTTNTTIRALWSNSTYICEAGQYLPANSATCADCPAGSYCPGDDLQYDDNDNHGITVCAAGYYSGASASSCTICPAGSYAEGTGNTSCTTCPGSMTSVAGSDQKTDCKISCNAGEYLAVSSSVCSTCPAGKYCSNSQTYNYSDDIVQGITGDCNAGTYSTGGQIAATCTAMCAVGSYSTVGSSACVACPNGKTTSSTGSTGSGSCITCSNNSQVASWLAQSWTANSVTNLCSINTCNSNYFKSGNVCTNSVVITFNANGGSGAPGQMNYTYNPSGTTNGYLPTKIPARSGYQFMGWSESPSGSNPLYQPGVAWYYSNISRTLYAKWNNNNTCTVAYDANGGSGAPNPTIYTWDKSGSTYTNLASGTPTRSGKTFKGWSDSSTATSASYSPGQTWYCSNGSRILYAVWG